MRANPAGRKEGGVERVGLVAFVFCLAFVAPILFATLALGAGWKIVSLAYLIWFGLLAVPILGKPKRRTEVAGFVVGMGMFLTFPATAILASLLQFVPGL